MNFTVCKLCLNKAVFKRKCDHCTLPASAKNNAYYLDTEY